MAVEPENKPKEPASDKDTRSVKEYLYDKIPITPRALDRLIVVLFALLIVITVIAIYSVA